MFYLPVNKLLYNATHIEILLLCGPAFMLVRVLGLFTDLCKGADVGSLRLDRYLLFVLYAPTFRLGPVTRYAQMNAEFDRCKSQLNGKMILWGVGLILLGLFQFELVDEIINKRLIKPYHDRTFFYLSGFFGAASKLSFTDALIGMYYVALRFWFGFSGYSNVARGLSMMMGINLPKNFDSPYVVNNLQDFWRRWHITMGSWLKDYVYIPLGGRNYRGFSTLAVFVYCMMWHQPAGNMLLFAFLHAGGLVVYQLWRQWINRLAERKAKVYQLACAMGIARGPVGTVLGILITFHFWCLTLLVMFDPKDYGLGMLKRIVVDPILMWI